MRISLLVALLIGSASAGLAQGTEIDRAESLVAEGNYDEARSLLTKWWESSSGGEKAPPEVRARALFLRARLASDPAAAQQDYLSVALGYPTTPQAPAALLHLGQTFLATGDIVRANAYLERLTIDYPNNPHRTMGLLWFARARHAAGRSADACSIARDGAIAAAHDPDLVSLFRVEENTACRAAAARTVTAPPPQPQRQAQANPSPAPAGSTTAGTRPAATGRFAVQVGAFRDRRGAETLAGQLRKAGHEPRIVLIPGSNLWRVRVGRFQSSADAQAYARRVRAQGFTVALVNDAANERTR